MPSASFYANFAQFDREVERAKQTLGAFEIPIRNVQGSLKRLEQAYDGSRLIGEAIKTAAAIEKIAEKGGLTEAELRKLNARFEEAAEKARRVGQAMPDAFDKVAASVKSQLAPLEQASQKTTMWGSALGSVKTVAGGMIAGFTLDRVISGIGSAAASTIQWGGALTDMAAQTGVSSTALQRWEYAAKQGGNTLDQVVKASGELSKKLAEGQDSTVAALERLGIKFADIRQLGPEQQLETVSAALARTSDQGTKASASMALLGDVGKELLPTLTGDIRKVGDEAERLGVIVDEQTLQAMDQLGDSWAKLETAGRSLIAGVLEPMVPALNAIADAALSVGKNGSFGWLESYASATGNVPLMQLAGLWMGDRGLKKTGDINLTGGGTAPWVPAYERPGYSGTVVNSEEWFVKSLTEAARAQEIAARELEASAKAWREWNGQLRNQTNWAVTEIGINQGPTGGWNGGGGYLNTVGDLTNPWGGTWSPYGIGNALAAPAFKLASAGNFNWGGIGLSGLNAAMPFISNAIGGGQAAGVGGSIGGSIGGILGSSSMLGGLKGFTGFAGMLGAAAPFLGPALGIVGSLIGKAFQPAEGRLVSQDRSQYLASVGGAEGFNQQFRDAKISGDEAARLTGALMSADSKKEYEAAQAAIAKAIQRNTQLLQEQAATEAEIADIEAERTRLSESLVTTWDQIVSITDKYGINIEGLGGKVNQLGATTTWTQMLNDIQALERAGADVGGVLVGMSDEMSALVQAAKRAGTEIPENLRPYLQSVADAGELLDENGDKITDLSTLKWGPPVKTQADIVKDSMATLEKTFQTLADRLDTILSKIAGIPSAAQAASGSTITIGYRYQQEGDEPASSPYRGQADVGHASGALITSPHRAWVGEGGEPELIGPVSFMERALAGAMNRAGWGAGVTIQPAPVLLDRRVLGEVMFEVLPQVLRRAGLAAA